MIDEGLLRYLYHKLPARSPFFEEMENVAKTQQVPIMDPYSMETVLQILRIQKPKSILELGAAIGYSALRMADAVQAQIVTVERDESRYYNAKENIRLHPNGERITLLKGDAFNLVDKIATFAPFDCLFIDAAKGQYRRFFECFSPYLSERGLVITDNVLFKGFVYNDSTENKRLANLGKKIKDYNDWLINHPDFHTVILPVGDGIAISVKN